MRREWDFRWVLDGVVLGVAASGLLAMAAHLFSNGRETEAVLVALPAVALGVLTGARVRHVWRHRGRPSRAEPLPDPQPHVSPDVSQPEAPSTASTDWATVFESSNPLEIQVARDALARDGIPVEVFGEQVSSIFGSLPSIPARVMVPAALAEQAARMLHAFADPDAEE